MASLPVCDPVGDHLLTPQNSALVVIDYQPSQFAGVRSIDRDLLSGSLEKVAYQSQQMPVASKSSPTAHTRQPTQSREKCQ